MDVLSQNEIDQLLGAIASAETPATDNNRRIKIYDFKRPDRMSKSFIRYFDKIFNKICYQLSLVFDRTKKYGYRVRCISADQLMFEEYIRSVPFLTNVLCIPAEIEGQKDNLFLEIPYEIVDDIKNREYKKFRDKRNFFTDFCVDSKIKKLFRSLIKTIETELRAQDIQVEFGKYTLEKNTSDVYVTNREETGLLMTLEVIYKNEEDLMTVFFPYPLMRNLVKKHKKNLDGCNEQKKKNPVDFSNVKVDLYKTPIPFEITMKDLRALNVGDVIDFNTNKTTYRQFKIK